MRSDDPAEAFDALRSEVALLRRAIEGLSAHQPEAPPDYAPTLAKIEKATTALAERVEDLAGNPALGLTPEIIASQLRTHGSAARAEVHEELLAAMTGLSNATRIMTKTAGLVRTGASQRRWIGGAALAGAVCALIAWLGLSGPIMRALPAAWQVPERVAAATLGQDRWAAGARLLGSADVAAWRRLQVGEGLLAQNRDVLEACWRRAQRLKRSVPCDVRVGG